MRSNPRPRTITWIFITAFFFSLLHFARLALSFGLPALPLTVPLWYLTITGAIWGVLGVAIVLGFLLRKPWTTHTLRWGSVAYILWYWMDKLLLVRADYPRGSWPFSLIISMCALAFIFWSLQRPEIRAYLQKEER